MSAGTQATWPERDFAIRLANTVLDNPGRDPDDDLAVLARQFLRAIEWRPAETAPRNNTEIIYRRKNGQIGRCAWDAGAYGEDEPAWWDIDADQEAYPDYWLPLPPPPVSP